MTDDVHYYGVFDANGLPKGFYNSDVYQDVGGNKNPAIPASAVEITKAQWLEFLGHPGTRSWNGTDVMAYVPPPPPVLFQDSISRRQFFQQLAVQKDITEDEALAAVQSGAIPAALQSVVAALPASDQFNAKMLLAGATTFKFSNPLTAALAAALTPPRTTEQMKALWSAAAQLV